MQPIKNILDILFHLQLWIFFLVEVFTQFSMPLFGKEVFVWTEKYILTEIKCILTYRHCWLLRLLSTIQIRDESGRFPSIIQRTEDIRAAKSNSTHRYWHHSWEECDLWNTVKKGAIEVVTVFLKRAYLLRNWVYLRLLMHTAWLMEKKSHTFEMNWYVLLLTISSLKSVSVVETVM